MNAQQFNAIIGAAINEGMKQGVAKHKMTTLQMAEILSGSATCLLRAVNAAMADDSAVHKQTTELTNIIIPLKKNEKCD